MLTVRRRAFAAWTCCLLHWGANAEANEAQHLSPDNQIYVPGADGTRLALDVFLATQSRQTPAPTALLSTRYGRREDRDADRITVLRKAGFNFVIADARGSGASFGNRPIEFSDAEVADVGAVIDWIVKQPWSNGQVATTGNSYAADISDLATTLANPALRAAIVRHAEFNPYRHLLFPGGVRNIMLLRAWGAYVAALDRANSCAARLSGCQSGSQLAAVDDDPTGSQLRDAILQHQLNYNPYRDGSAWQFRDDMASGAIPFDAVSIESHFQQSAGPHVPVQYWGSWLDAGTAAAGIEQFVTWPSAPMELYLAPWVHGGYRANDPFLSSKQGNPLPHAMQLERQAAFMRRAMTDAGSHDRIIHYWPLNGTGFKSTTVWPVAGMTDSIWFLGPRHTLARSAGASGVDSYAVDFGATTGRNNRWFTQIADVGILENRSKADRRALTYTSSPLPDSLELTGYPTIEITLATSRTDGALFVYLEDVSPNGRVTYLTEGELRLINRGGILKSAPAGIGVMRSFARSAARPMIPGVADSIMLPLWPVSARLKRRHRVRIAITGADADTFDRYPPRDRPGLASTAAMGHFLQFISRSRSGQKRAPPRRQREAQTSIESRLHMSLSLDVAQQPRSRRNFMLGL